MKEEMTVHRALAELKVLNSRIANKKQEIVYIATYKSSQNKVNGVELNQFKDTMLSNYQSLNDMLRRSNAIDMAIKLSNATTKVKIGDVETTIVGAINMKNVDIPRKESLCQDMVGALYSANRVLQNENGDKLMVNTEKWLTSMYSGKENFNSKECIEMRENYIKVSEFKALDPLNIEKKIKDLREEIDTFKSEVDAVLSESNALTKIIVEY